MAEFGISWQKAKSRQPKLLLLTFSEHWRGADNAADDNDDDHVCEEGGAI